MKIHKSISKLSAMTEYCRVTVQHSTIQYITAQYSTVWYSTVQQSQYGTVQHSTAAYSTAQHSITGQDYNTTVGLGVRGTFYTFP